MSAETKPGRTTVRQLRALLDRADPDAVLVHDDRHMSGFLSLLVADGDSSELPGFFLVWWSNEGSVDDPNNPEETS